MHNVFKVFKFELTSIINKKSIKVSTVIMCIAVLIATSLPTIISAFTSSDDSSSVMTDTGLDVSTIGFMFNSPDITAAEFTAYVGSQIIVYTDENALRKDVQSGTLSNGYIIQDQANLTSIVQNRDMYSSTDQIIISLMQTINRDKALTQMGIDPEAVDAVSYSAVNLNAEILGKDASSSFLISYILMFGVYMLVIMYGSFVSTSVAREKDNRTMEILITSTNPSALIIGKVFANAIGGFGQFFLIICAGLAGYLLNQASYPDYIMQMLFSGLSLDAVMIFLLFTSVGYLLYLFLYASLGSLVSKVEDVGSAVTPITMLFMLAYICASIGMNMPTSIIVKFGSYIPFVAILAMPIRYFLTSVPIIELLISITLMILTTVFLAYLSIKIYRLGSLSYGNKISFIKAVKMVFAKDNIDI